jgi:thioredoxin-like negative regulator of GroEL
MSNQEGTVRRIALDEIDRVLVDPRPVLISFESSSCSPCSDLAPRLDEVAREFGARAIVVRVSGGDDPSVAARHHLVWVPTLAFWLGGRERLRLSGAVPIATLRSHIRFLLEDGPLPEPAFGPRRMVVGPFRPRASH